LEIEVLTAIILKVPIFSNIAPCSQYMNRRVGGRYYSHVQGRKSAEDETSVLAGGPAQFMRGKHGAISWKMANFI
jgi:hypothetical protein